MTFMALCPDCETSFYRINKEDFICPKCGEIIPMSLRPHEWCVGSRPIKADDEGKTGDGVND